MTGRLPLYTDADVDGPVVKALQSAGWDVLRAIDAYPEKTHDHIHFARAAQGLRVLVSNDIDMKMLAETWLLEGRSYPPLRATPLPTTRPSTSSQSAEPSPGDPLRPIFGGLSGPPVVGL